MNDYQNGVDISRESKVPNPAKRPRWMIAFVLAAVGFADIGCQRTNGDAATKEPESGLLRVPETEKHLGVLTKGQKLPSVVLFEVVNRSNEPVYLETGRPTCGCLRVLIENGSELPPGGTGRIRMELSTHEREGGGRFAEEVSLFVRKRPPPSDSSKPATNGGEEAAGGDS